MAIVLYVVAVVVIVGGFTAAGFAPTEFMGAREAFYAKLLLALPALLIGLLLAGLAAVVSVLQRLELQGREIIALLPHRVHDASASTVAETGATVHAPVPATAEVERPFAYAEPITPVAATPDPVPPPPPAAAPVPIPVPSMRLDRTERLAPSPTEEPLAKPRSWRERLGLAPAAAGVAAGAAAGVAASATAAATAEITPEPAAPEPEASPRDEYLPATDVEDDPNSAAARVAAALAAVREELAKSDQARTLAGEKADQAAPAADPELQLEDLLPSKAASPAPDADRVALLGQDILAEALSEPEPKHAPEVPQPVEETAALPDPIVAPELIIPSDPAEAEDKTEAAPAPAPTSLPPAPQLPPSAIPTRAPTVAELLQRDPSDAEADAPPIARVTREGQFAGRRYRMFGDGSLEIDTEQSTIRFSSLDEFRAFVASASKKPGSDQPAA